MIQGFVEAEKLIKQAENILLATHEEPDGDAIGSLLAMKIGLEKIGKKTTAFFPAKVPSSLKFLPHLDQLTHQVNLVNIDLIIGLDYGHYQRLKLNNEDLASRNFLTIDHHLVGKHLGFLVINNDYSSTAEILYEFFPYLNVTLEREIATCLLTGIFSDTGGFRYPNTSAQTLRIVSDLLLKGAPLQKIAKFADNPDLPDNLDAWVEAFKNLKVDMESGLIFSLVAYKNLADCKEGFNSSAIANLLSSAPEIKLALLCAEKQPGQIECSLRSQNNRGINVAKIAQLFGGGGHKLAAGFQTTAKAEEIINTIKNLAWQNFSA